MDLGALVRLEARPAHVAILNARLLTLQGPALDEAVEDELVRNPALERRPACGRCGRPSAFSVCRRCRRPPHGGQPADLGQEESWRDVLTRDAAAGAPARLRGAIVVVVGNLDDHGLLLGVTPAGLADLSGQPLAEVQAALAAVRAVGPPGIATFDVASCLVAQLDALSSEEGVDLARTIVGHHLEALAEGRLDDIAAALAASPDSVAQAVDLIRRHVQPWPVADTADHPVRAAPDVELAVSVDPAGEPVVVATAADPWRGALRLAPDIVDLSRSTDRRARVFAAELLSAARAFLLALDRRATTVERVATAAGRHHAEHLLAGSLAFQPLTRRQVAEELDLHESTISRAVTGRVAKLPGGRVVALSRLFGSGHDVRARVAELVGGNGALSDREVAGLLAVEGIPASRRTVAKHRAELGLGRRQKPPSRRAGRLAPAPKPGSPEPVAGSPNQRPPSGWHGTCSQGD